MKDNYDFGGYATKVNLKCADGRVILPDAFKENDGQTVPLVWHHLHDDPANVLGHALLENRPDGIYCWAKFNSTPSGENGKLLVEHKDVVALSIYANGLVQKESNVVHGVIREVSLVLAGSNPGAKIDYINIVHSDGSETLIEDEAVITSGLELEYSIKDIKREENMKKEIKHADSAPTIQEIFDTLDELQKEAVYAIIGQVLEDNDISQSDEEGDNEDNNMKTNVFNIKNKDGESMELTHAQFNAIVEDAKKIGSLKAAVLKHVGEYGIGNIEYLFPDAKSVTGNEPVFVSRDMTWVRGFIGGTKHTPFSRIKSMSADITLDQARALGYVKGTLKKEEYFALSQRTTTPKTIYKKQKLDRDDIVDITDMNVVAWLKREMRMLLDEEIARAALVSDGRDPADPDKITEVNIRPVYKDASFYTTRIQFEADATIAEIEEEILRARKDYKGSGGPTLYCTSDFLTDLLLQKDGMQRRIYATEAELAAALRVSSIVEVPVMEGCKYESGGTTYDLLGIILNPRDYVMGADSGGEVNMFDDFDIDYNQYKYLIETRLSGALVLPASAQVIEIVTTESV